MSHGDTELIGEKLAHYPPSIHKKTPSPSLPAQLVDTKLSAPCNRGTASPQSVVMEPPGPPAERKRKSKAKPDQAFAAFIDALNEDTQDEFDEMLTYAFANSPKDDSN